MHVVAVADAAAHRKAYPSDASDEEWAFVLAYLTVCREDAPQRTHDLREVFNAARDMVKTGAPWRWMRPAIFRLGPWSISRRSVGSKRVCSKRWS